MKKALFTLLLITLLAVGLTVSVSADTIQSGTWGNLSWTLNETTGELVISGEGDMVAFEPYASSAWLAYKEKILSITIQDGITSIGPYAFEGCQKLSGFTLPDSVVQIGYYSFRGCNGLSEITIPNSCTNISEDAFWNCEYTLVDVTAPSEAIPAIKRMRLRNVVITSGTSIAGNAFSGSSSLESISIPDNVTTIGNFAFYNCISLKSIHIPDGVISIGYQAFQNCQTLESIVIPETVTSVGQWAFMGCKNLRTAVLPQNVTVIEPYTFWGCVNLTSVTVSQNLERIETKAFYSCDSLSEIILPDSVVYIGEWAFADCVALKKVVIPNDVQTIIDNAFDTTWNIETVVTPIAAIFYIPKNNLKTVVFTSGTQIPDNAFSKCTTLQKVIFCGSETEWESLQQNKNWLKDLEGIEFLYHSCQWDITDAGHSGTCAECGAEIAGEHIWDDGVVTTPPTHLATGIQTCTCIVCQSTATIALEKTENHRYDACIEYDDKQHKKTCECGDIVYEDHTYGAGKVVTPATEEREGERQKGCKCGHKIIEPIPMLSHRYLGIVVAPTCTEQGYTTYTCQNCNNSYRERYVDMLGHSYDNDQDATCNVCNATRDVETVTEQPSVSEETTANPAEEEKAGCGASLASESGITFMLLIVAVGALYKKKKQL